MRELRTQNIGLQKGLYSWTREMPVPRHVPFLRLDDRIHELCTTVVNTDDRELESLMSELQAALREHNHRLRKLAAAKLPNPLPHP
jgi:hypothetical protein